MAVSKPFSPSATLGLAGGQVVLAVIIAIITATKLDGEDCYLNLAPELVCNFVYATVGFSLLFTLMLAIPTWLWTKKGSKEANEPLIAEASHLALFGSFWWLVLSLTITIRGNQAADAGAPEGAARNAVIGLSWIQTVLFLATAVVVIADRVLHKPIKARKDDDAVSDGSSDGSGYVYTQALARTPVQ